jgi:ribosomal protein S18 acetylase RimI-like enzyme
VRPLDDAPSPPRSRDALTLVSAGVPRLRVGRWLGRADVAAVVLLPGPEPPSVGDVRAWARRLRTEGYRRVVTSALAPREQAPFLAAGFTVHEQLHLLSHHLHPVPAAPRHVALRRMHRNDREAVLSVDAAAFGDARRFDASALDDAVAATVAGRQRVATDPEGQVTAYAVSGRSRGVGYLQRLAVAPSHHREGLGAALVVDSLRWMRRHGADEALVNTHHGNEPALALYEGLGFRLEGTSLAVLGAELEP